MNKRTGLIKLAVFVTPEEDALILQESKVKRRIPKQDWIAEAAREKLHRDTGASIGPADLSSTDRKRVEWYRDLLREAPDDPQFRVAVDGLFELFDRSLRK